MECAKTKKHRIKNEGFPEHSRAIGGKLRDGHLRWFGDVLCRLAMTLFREKKIMQADHLRKRDRPKRIYSNDRYEEVQPSKDLAQKRSKWRL